MLHLRSVRGAVGQRKNKGVKMFMSMILFALIGAKLNAGALYWAAFIIYCAVSLSAAIKSARGKH